MMKSYPYNRESAEGRRLFKLLDAQFNPGVIDANTSQQKFETYDVLSVMQCRVNRASFLFPSNLSGVKRPQIRVESNVEIAWGEFTDNITAMDFSTGDVGLPLTYTQPLDDDTMKYLIDAGLYSDPKFERLMSKLMTDEVYDAEANMRISYMDVKTGDVSLPIFMADPVDVVHNDHDPSERTTLSDLVKRTAAIALELRKEGVNADQVMQLDEPSRDDEVLIDMQIEDNLGTTTEREIEEAADRDLNDDISDADIDLTDEIDDRELVGPGYTSEDDRIREAKARRAQEEFGFNPHDDDFDPDLLEDIHEEAPRAPIDLVKNDEDELDR